MNADVNVIYRYFCCSNEACTPDQVQLSTSHIQLKVGMKLAIKRDPATPLSTRETRFFQDTNYDLLEFVEAVYYHGLPLNESFADGIVLRAVKPGTTQIEIIPRYSDFENSAILKIKIERPI